MHVELHVGPQALLDAAGPWLLAREPENNVVLASAYLLIEGDHPFSEPYFLASIVERGRVVGAGLRTPPDSLHLTVMPAGAAAALAGPVAESHATLPSVSGPLAPAREFAQAWVRERGGVASVRHLWQLYVLEHAVPYPGHVPGRLRLAGEADLDVLRDWGPRYAREVNTPVDVTAFLERMTRRRSLYLWDDGQPRCLVSMSGHTPNGVRVSAVYTPDEHRNRGYASAAVAATTSAALAEGARFCMLLAETKDEAPNRIYRRLGFRALREQVMIDLAPEAPALAAAGAALLGVRVRRAQPMPGGSLSGIVSLELEDGGTAVVKGGPAPRTEAAMLEALRAAGAPVPAVLGVNDEVLALERVPAGGRLGRAWPSLGSTLRRVHAVAGRAYGWDADYAFGLGAGAVAIENARGEDWPAFWAERRLLVHAGALPAALAVRVERLARTLPERLPARPLPSLLHGDLWGGNVLVEGSAVSALVDPACYYGHAEVDVAMLALFDRPGEAFFDAYGALEPGHEERIAIYTLWPALVHVRLFGGSYVGLAERLLGSLGV